MGYGDIPYGREIAALAGPEWWDVRGGAPAAFCGEYWLGDARGLPSAEMDNGFQVWEFMFVTHHKLDHEVRMWPLRYDTISSIADGGLCPMHHGVEAMWEYRPSIYVLDMDWGDPARGWKPLAAWTRCGSQRELQWRQGLHATMMLKSYLEDGEKAEAAMKFIVDRVDERRAVEKAEVLLESMLGPTQLFEYRLFGTFRVVGADTGNWYRVTPGDGFSKVNGDTDEQTISYCYHPEDWLPDADIALSIKLHLEDADLEEDFVSGAHANPKKPKLAHREAQPRFNRAMDMERELLVRA